MGMVGAEDVPKVPSSSCHDAGIMVLIMRHPPMFQCMMAMMFSNSTRMLISMQSSDKTTVEGYQDGFV